MRVKQHQDTIEKAVKAARILYKMGCGKVSPEDICQFNLQRVSIVDENGDEIRERWRAEFYEDRGNYCDCTTYESDCYAREIWSASAKELLEMQNRNGKNPLLACWDKECDEIIEE